MNYDSFITLITKKCQDMSSTLSVNGLHFDSCYTIFPPSVFDSLWIALPLFGSQGISPILPLITKSVNRFLMNVSKTKENSQLRKRQFDHIISLIFSAIVTYKSHNAHFHEITDRAKQMKKTWNIGSNICSNLIFVLQCGDDKENDPESKKLKVINDLLVMFDTNESKLDYKNISLNILRQTVGELVYSLNTYDQTEDEIYKRLYTSNRQKIIYLLSKIKKKQRAFASILDAIVTPNNNNTELSRKINICSIFLLAENWDRFKQADSKLKDTRVIQILAEAFERIFYLAYSDNLEMGILLLNFLHYSKFTLFDEIKQAIAYHLLALYKFFICAQKNTAAKLIQRIWNEKLKGVRILQAYYQYAPSFMGKSQWTQQRFLEQSDTRSVNSKSSKQERLSLRSNRKSRSKQKSLSMKSSALNNLNKRLKYIQEELRRCNFERVYLLMESLKKYYLDFEDKRIEQISRNSVISLIILLIKKIQGKIEYRYDCSLLKKAIYMESMELKQKCFVDGIFQYNEKNASLGLFQCCYMDKGEINFDNFIKFHEKNNYEDTLQTLYNLKALFDDLNSNNLSGTKLQSYQQQLSALQFEFKVYHLYKNQFNQNKKIDAKRLLIICKLLLLKSTNITNNLLVNYVYLMLKQQRNLQSAHKKKIQSYSKIMNYEISLQNNQQRIKIFFIMGQIFQDFSQQTSKIFDSGMENKYYQLLRRKEHAPYYFLYYQNYLKMNYLKEALYFLELHCFTQKNLDNLMMKNAINLYQRLNVPFKTYIKSILKQLKMQQSDLQKDESKKQKKKLNLESIVLRLRNQIDNDVDLANRYDEYSKFQIWLNYYYRYVDFFIKELAAQKESQQINESLRKYAIMVKYTHLKIDMSRQPDLVITYNDLRIIIDIIQKLRNEDDRNHFYLYFLELLEKSNEIQVIQDIYLQNLLKCKKYQEMLDYLRRNLKPSDSNAKLKTNYLCYLLKYHFQRSQFDICLSMITVLAQRKQKIRNPTQIYHMQLQCKYKIMLNYTIQQYLSLICKSIKLQSKNDLMKESKEDHFKFYFKIFRMLFNRYNFTNTIHNQIFLEAYFSFIDENKILTDNIQFIGETILYLLRFVAEKFDYSPTSIAKQFEKVIMKKFQGQTSHFVPFCTYLIKRISLNMPKNQVIKSILKTILSQNPKECIWTISFLKNFNFIIKPQKASRMSPQETNQIQQIAQLYKEVYDVLVQSNSMNTEHLNWIDNLVILSLSQTETKKQKSYSFKQLPVPPQLIFMFNKDYYINRMDDIRVLSNGKSAPLQIVFNLTHIKEKNYLTVKVIIKANVGVKKYRMQSNTANFFEEIGLLDADITYKIIHLSKCLVLIEHRSNCGTVNSILNECVPQLKKIEGIFLSDIAKRRSNNPQEKRLLQIFDNNNRYQNRIRLSEFIYYKTKNIRDWWKRYNNFVRTHARWSYLGYIVGLGDRHCDNILATDEGKLIHIDFQYVLDTGLKLPYPQWVPFRLTSSFIQPLGILGVFGMYFGQMVQTVRQFEQKQHSVWKALSHFIGSMDTNVCEQIIQRSKFTNMGVGSAQEGVTKLIFSAMNPELLRLMFDGWRAYL